MIPISRVVEGYSILCFWTLEQLAIHARDNFKRRPIFAVFCVGVNCLVRFGVEGIVVERIQEKFIVDVGKIGVSNIIVLRVEGGVFDPGATKVTGVFDVKGGCFA